MHNAAHRARVEMFAQNRAKISEGIALVKDERQPDPARVRELFNENAALVGRRTVLVKIVQAGFPNRYDSLTAQRAQRIERCSDVIGRTLGFMRMNADRGG
jgi:3-deoxy-D-arabino-heptulosonate 7-phosphate (DAHP) synthase class II